MMHGSASAPESKLDLVFAFQQELCKHLQLVVPFTSDVNGTMDIEEWSAAVDARCEVHQLRHYLLTYSVAPEILAALVGRFIALPHPSGTDRSKIDLLLVHYLAQTLSSGQADLTLVAAAKLLEPVLGPTTPAPVPALMTLVGELDVIGSLRDLLERKVLERMQKARAEHHNYTPASLVIFAWMGLQTRRACVRLLLTDIDRIERNLTHLKSIGIKRLPTRGAQTDSAESIVDLMNKCRIWKRPFPDKYRDESWLAPIAELCSVSELAVQVAAKGPGLSPIRASGATPTEDSPIQEQKDVPSKSVDKSSPLQGVISEIRSGVESVHSADFARVQAAEVTVILSSAEIRAFRFVERPGSSLLMNMAASRALLSAAAKNSDKTNLEDAKNIARDLLDAARSAIALAEQANDSESAIDLRASIRTLEKALAR